MKNKLFLLFFCVAAYSVVGVRDEAYMRGSYEAGRWTQMVVGIQAQSLPRPESWPTRLNDLCFLAEGLNARDRATLFSAFKEFPAQDAPVTTRAANVMIRAFMGVDLRLEILRQVAKYPVPDRESLAEAVVVLRQGTISFDHVEEDLRSLTAFEKEDRIQGAWSVRQLGGGELPLAERMELTRKLALFETPDARSQAIPWALRILDKIEPNPWAHSQALMLLHELPRAHWEWFIGKALSLVPGKIKGEHLIKIVNKISSYSAAEMSDKIQSAQELMDPQMDGGDIVHLLDILGAQRDEYRSFKELALKILDPTMTVKDRMRILSTMNAHRMEMERSYAQNGLDRLVSMVQRAQTSLVGIFPALKIVMTGHKILRKDPALEGSSLFSALIDALLRESQEKPNSMGVLDVFNQISRSIVDFHERRHFAYFLRRLCPESLPLAHENPAPETRIKVAESLLSISDSRRPFIVEEALKFSFLNVPMSQLIPALNGIKESELTSITNAVIGILREWAKYDQGAAEACVLALLRAVSKIGDWQTREGLVQDILPHVKYMTKDADFNKLFTDLDGIKPDHRAQALTALEKSEAVGQFMILKAFQNMHPDDFVPFIDTIVETNRMFNPPLNDHLFLADHIRHMSVDRHKYFLLMLRDIFKLGDVHATIKKHIITGISRAATTDHFYSYLLAIKKLPPFFFKNVPRGYEPFIHHILEGLVGKSSPELEKYEKAIRLLMNPSLTLEKNIRLATLAAHYSLDKTRLFMSLLERCAPHLDPLNQARFELLSIQSLLDMRPQNPRILESILAACEVFEPRDCQWRVMTMLNIPPIFPLDPGGPITAEDLAWREMENTETDARKMAVLKSIRAVQELPQLQTVELDYRGELRNFKQYVSGLTSLDVPSFFDFDEQENRYIQVGLNRIAKVLHGPKTSRDYNFIWNDSDHYEGYPVKKLFAQFWYLTRVHGDAALLKISFAKALADSIDDQGRIVCHNGKFQRLVRVLQGYYPGIALDNVEEIDVNDALLGLKHELFNQDNSARVTQVQAQSIIDETATRLYSQKPSLFQEFKQGAALYLELIDGADEQL